MQAKFVRILAVVAALIGLNVLSAFLFVRLDLTAEKRYTLSPATAKLLSGLDDDVHLNIYLAGDLPPGFQRLENAVRETVDEFQAVANQSVTYRFIDPTAVTNEKEKTAMFEQLGKKGVVPTNLNVRQSGQLTKKLIFPWAVVSYKGKDAAVLLLKGNMAASPAEQLNQSYEGVEFQLASAIQKLTQVPGSRRKVGLLAGNTQVPPSRLSDLLASIQENYDLFYIDLTKPGAIAGVDALLVPKPDQPFSDDAVYKIDQFVVNGGRALFFVDGQRVDSVNAQGSFAQPLDVNLDDLFFRWGVRINRDLVKDLSSAAIPLNVGTLGDKPNIQLVPWRFYPILNNFGTGKSPITRNLDAVYARFVSTLDTVRSDGILKTPLLLTSPYTKILKAPVLVGYNEAQQQPDPRTYDGGARLVGCLLEGSFRSVYAGRILPGDARLPGFRASGSPSRVLICSDGDLLVNDVDYRRNVPYPLGYDRYTRTQFANKDFVLNALDYLVDPDGVIAARTRTVALRPLDKIRINEERTGWQLLNLLGPLVLIGAVGGVWQVLRKRKYGR
ncbi:MAG: gliding motility-associated ABC transporter substrate-binding protein GldG [Bacteroidetes bacterium]|nr:gliding motility-associated ABC transporter substrate-binding protein GldG [Fibrella sp.]